jgi:hypothetical protein
MMCPGVGRVGNEGRDGTEIDIMEKPWLDDRVQHTFHWDGYGKAHKSEGKVVKVPGMMEGFHTFAIWWKPNCPISSWSIMCEYMIWWRRSDANCPNEG